MENAKVNFTRINNDVNGNPRLVCHYFNLLKQGDNGYETALKNSRKLGGRKFHNKQYGGGIAFQCYNESELEKDILKLTGYENA